jgi:Concanavalin A-like lectin/glucanases superfamily
MSMSHRVSLASSGAIVCALMVSVISANPYSDLILSDNPVAYYRLDETTGSVAANSSTAGSALNGNIVGYSEAPEGSDPITIGQAGPRPGDPSGERVISGFEASNHAIHSGINYTEYPTMSGDNPRVEVPDFDGSPLKITGPLTLEAWIYRDQQTPLFADTNEGIVDKYQGGGGQRAFELVLQANSAGLHLVLSRFGVYESKYDFATDAGVVPLGEWTHVAATYVPSTRMAIFVNGSLVAERTDPSGIPGFIFDSVAPLWIGTQLNVNNNDPARNGNTAFEGRIDEVAVYDTALTDAQILAHYQAAATAAPPVLAGDYNDDGVVDAADYTSWRDNLGGSSIPNETVSLGVVDQEDYDEWKAHFGAGGGAASQASVPEPAGLCGLFSGVLFFSLTMFYPRRRALAQPASAAEN